MDKGKKEVKERGTSGMGKERERERGGGGGGGGAMKSRWETVERMRRRKRH